MSFIKLWICVAFIATFHLELDIAGRVRLDAAMDALALESDGSAVEFQHENVSAANVSSPPLFSWPSWAKPIFRCGIGQADVIDGSNSRVGVTDPRASIKKLGGWGVAAKVVQISRTMLYMRAFALELPGHAAANLILAQYGVIHAKIPPLCYPDLRAVLEISPDAPWEHVRKFRSRRAFQGQLIDSKDKKRGKTLDEILDIVPCGCDRLYRGKCTADAHEVLDKRSRKALQALKWGYWRVFEEYTEYPPEGNDTAAYVHRSGEMFRLAVVNVDPWRWKRGSKPERRHLRTDLRQVWYYGRTHLLLDTEGEIRDQLVRPSSVDEHERLKRQMYTTMILEGLRLGEIQGIEINARRDCISASPTNVMKLVSEIEKESNADARFRTTVLWREKFWKSFLYHPLKSLVHPWTAFRKSMERVGDKWQRIDRVMSRVGMILKPISVAVFLAGIAVGIATGGEGSLVTLIGSQIMENGFAFVVTSSISAGLLDLLLVKAMEKPVSLLFTHTSAEVTKQMMTNDGIQRLFRWMTSSEAIDRLREAIDSEIHRVMDNLDVVGIVREKEEELLAAGIISEDVVRRLETTLQDADEYAELYAEVFRYVESLVFAGFIAEASSSLEQFINRALVNRFDENYGWVNWHDWKKYGEKNKDTIKKLPNLRIKFDPPFNGTLCANFDDSEGLSDKTGAPKEGSVCTKVKSGMPFMTLPLKVVTFGQKKSLGTLKVTIRNGKDEETFTLDDKRRQRIYVKDFQAYERLQSTWLQYDDWAKHRTTGRSSMALIHKNIHFDGSLKACADFAKRGPYNAQLLRHLPTAPNVKPLATVVGYKWKSRGSRTIRIRVGDANPGAAPLGSRRPPPPPGDPRRPPPPPAYKEFNIVLEPRVKRCLRIHDADAWRVFEADKDRRTAEIQWLEGTYTKLRRWPTQKIASGDVIQELDPYPVHAQRSEVMQEQYKRSIEKMRTSFCAGQVDNVMHGYLQEASAFNDLRSVVAGEASAGEDAQPAPQPTRPVEKVAKPRVVDPANLTFQQRRQLFEVKPLKGGESERKGVGLQIAISVDPEGGEELKPFPSEELDEVNLEMDMPVKEEVHELVNIIGSQNHVEQARRWGLCS